MRPPLQAHKISNNIREKLHTRPQLRSLATPIYRFSVRNRKSDHHPRLSDHNIILASIATSNSILSNSTQTTPSQSPPLEDKRNKSQTGLGARRRLETPATFLTSLNTRGENIMDCFHHTSHM